jgi:hypothetical protein
MKPRILFFTAVLTSIAFVAPQGVKAKDKKASSPIPSASVLPQASPAGKTRAYPYHGKVASVDSAAQTFVIGKRTFTITGDTKITKDGATARVSDIASGELVGGSYWKQDNGTLAARTVKIGASAQTKIAPKTSQQTKAEIEN